MNIMISRNTWNKEIITTIFFLIVYMVVSCAPLPITVEEFEDNVGIRKGSQAKIKWKIANADRVQVKGDDKVYSPDDSIYVSP